MEGVAILRRQTKQFIDENPVTLQFIRFEQIDDGMGGHYDAEEPTPVDPQVVRIVEQASGSQAVERRNSAGEMVMPEFKIVAEWNADVLRGDTVEHAGLNLEVVWIILSPYEKTCDMAVR
jgi:hypothetical protein